MMSLMMKEAIRRAEAALDDVLALCKSGDASTAELRMGLGAFKSMRAKLDACQTHAAGGLATRERHGDGGAGVLAQTAGLSRKEAAGQVKTAQRLQALPEVQRAVERGQVSFVNAKVLADASDKTSPEAVAEDSELLAKASSLPADQFAREASRWSAQRKADSTEADWQRLRRRRRLRIWDGDDGMVHLRGEFDPVAGAKLRKRLHEQAEALRRGDLKHAEVEPRCHDQRMADALEALTADGTGAGTNRRTGRRADISIVQHLSADGTRDFAEIAGGAVIPQSVLEEHMCNASVAGIVFSDKGVPLWHGHSKTIATEAQFRALIAKYGGCAGCGAAPLLCQAHHIKPVSQGGATDITNMIPLCWHCHHKVHHHNWKVVPDGRGLRTIAPSDRIRHGPAHAPEAQLAHIPRLHNEVRPRAAVPPSPSSRAGPPRDVGSPVPRASVPSRRGSPRPQTAADEKDEPPHSQLQLVGTQTSSADPQSRGSGDRSPGVHRMPETPIAPASASGQSAPVVSDARAGRRSR